MPPPHRMEISVALTLAFNSSKYLLEPYWSYLRIAQFRIQTQLGSKWLSSFNVKVFQSKPHLSPFITSSFKIFFFHLKLMLLQRFETFETHQLLFGCHTVDSVVVYAYDLLNYGCKRLNLFNSLELVVVIIAAYAAPYATLSLLCILIR